MYILDYLRTSPEMGPCPREGGEFRNPAWRDWTHAPVQARGRLFAGMTLLETFYEAVKFS